MILSDLRQGQLVLIADAPDLEPQDSVWAVVSHDCDLANDFEAEIELVRATPVQSSDGNLTFAKSPRTLQVSTSDGRAMQLTMSSKRPIMKKTISEIHLFGELAERDRHTLRYWMSARYARPALPDAFNERRVAVRGKVRKALRSSGVYMTDIFVLLEDRELPPEETYNVDLLALMTVEDFEVQERRQTAETAMLLLAELLSSCDGIDVIEAGVRSEDDLTVHEVRYYKRLGFEDMSLRVGVVPDMPAPG